MSFIKLDKAHQKQVDALYVIELHIVKIIDAIEITGKNRWLAIGRTDIEKGFMALRKSITEKFKDQNASITNQ